MTSFDPSVAEEPEDGSVEGQGGSRNRLNAAFFARFVKGVQRTNDRVVTDLHVDNAHCALARTATAGLRRRVSHALTAAGTAPMAEDVASRAVLGVAEAQRKVRCTALLKEVARMYGFELRLEGDDDEGTRPEANRLTEVTGVDGSRCD